MSTGKVEGDLLYRTLKIDEGGYLNSSKVIKMSDQKTLKSKVLKSQMEINFENFIKFNIQVGTIVDVKENKKARKPAYVIDIDFGEKDGIKKSSAQITNYSKNELLNRKIIAVTNFPQKNIAGVLSEVLILGAITDKEVKLLGVNPNVENGTKIG